MILKLSTNIHVYVHVRVHVHCISGSYTHMYIYTYVHDLLLLAIASSLTCLLHNSVHVRCVTTCVCLHISHIVTSRCYQVASAGHERTAGLPLAAAAQRPRAAAHAA